MCSLQIRVWVSYANPYNLASSRLLWDLAPCELSGDQGTHVYPPPRAKTDILFIQCKVHVNEKQGHPMDLFLKKYLFFRPIFAGWKILKK